MKNLFSTTANTSRALGAAAAFLASGIAHSDEALLPPGTSLGQFPSSSIPTLQNAFANQIVSDITPDPALVPSNSFRWLLVHTDAGLALTLPEEYAGTARHFGQQEKFFVRFDTNTGLPEISFDLQTWQLYSVGTPVSISREERATILDISNNLQTLNTLQTQQATLSTTLAEQQAELTQVQAELITLQTNLTLTDYDLSLTESDLSQKESTRNTLEITMKPEAKLRTDTHLIATNTTLDDATKNTMTDTALDVYDTSSTIAQMPAPSPRSPQSNFVPPTLADVQSTVTALTSELSRIQTQITNLNTQITAKQNEITTTENEITALQNLISSLETDKVYWRNEYNYWKGEYDRLDAILTTASWNMGAAMSGYNTDKGKLENAGRTDIPSNIDASNLATLLSNLKNTIQAEADAVPGTPKIGTTGTDVGLPDETSSTRSYLEGNYKYIVDFPSSGVSWPATLRTYIQYPTKSNFSTGTTYAVYNRTHSIDTFNKTAKLRIEKLIQKGFVDNVLETDYENYKTQEGIIDTNTPKLKTAKINRDDADAEYFSTVVLLSAKEDMLLIEQEDKDILTQQKSELESLKSTKAQLQTLYTRVKTILDQLKQHVSSHGTLTQEITDLLNEAQTLENEIVALELLITSAEGDITDLENKVASTSDNLSDVNAALNQTEQALLATLQDIPNLRPADPITRTSSGALVPASQALNYFADGFRTGYSTKTLSGLPVKWIIRYHYDGTNADPTQSNFNNIYPASISLQYLLNGRAYTTDGQRVNNFSHKELMNSDLEKIMIQLNACIAVLNQYPAGSNTGIENFLTALKGKIAQLIPSQSPNAIIRNHVTETNTLTKKTLLQGGSYALFEQLLVQNATFANKIEAITALAVQKGNIPAGTDAIIDMRHMVTTILAREFTNQLMFNGTDGINLYTHWEQEALSFINGLGDTVIWDKQWDINADWNIDDHGNKYKFGFYHPGGANNSLYDPPATLFMLYSPDGSNAQVLGPVQVNSAAEADQTKERWQQELLKMKRSHVDNYSGGSYDLFRGTDEKGEYVWWGQSSKNGLQKSTTFSGDMKLVEGSTKALLEYTNISSNFSSNEAWYRSLFGLPYDYFSQNAQASLSGLLQLSDQNLSLALGQILDYSINVSVWSGHQKEVAKVIVSLSGVSGFPTDQVKAFQKKAIQQLDTLGADYEQDIINDTMIGGRNGNIEEIRTVVVLQRLSQLFMKKKAEMNAMNNTNRLDSATQKAQNTYGIELPGLNAGKKRFYFMIEEGAGESNIKKNIEFRRLCSLNINWTPNPSGGKIYFLGKEVDLAAMGNILLGYNAKQLGLSLHETVMGAILAQTGIDTFKALRDKTAVWIQGKDVTIETIVTDTDAVSDSILEGVFEGENEDASLYGEGFMHSDITPKGLLKLAK